MVTERLDTTLQSYYEKAPLILAEQVDILCDVLEGLEYIHSRGVIHRDLTTRNVLLTADPRRRAKFADVGLSRSVHGDMCGPLAIAGFAMTQCPGTMNYMPPEAFIPKPRYDRKLDVFAFAVLMITYPKKDHLPKGDAGLLKSLGVGRALANHKEVLDD